MKLEAHLLLVLLLQHVLVHKILLLEQQLLLLLQGCLLLRHIFWRQSKPGLRIPIGTRLALWLLRSKKSSRFSSSGHLSWHSQQVCL